MKKVKQILFIIFSIILINPYLLYNHFIYAQKTSIPKIQSLEPSTLDYEIYPLPRNITYHNGLVDLTGTINVIYGDQIDDATKQHATDTLSILNLNVLPSNQISKNNVNLVIGTYGSNDIANQQLGNIDKSLFNQIDAYIISIANNTITILGKDTDAAFYGVTSLKHIIKQLADAKITQIRHLLITDYAATQYRGFIEGYYGLPWSHENRLSLMEFGGEFKMNAYVFAPKDDPYHNSKWRELYPEADLVKVKELTQMGIKTKNRFVYTLHVFMHDSFRFDTEDNYTTDLNIVKAKFQQLYDNGVRQFGILADDSGGASAQNLARLTNDINNWLHDKDHPGTYETLFCPDHYNPDFAGWDFTKLKEINRLFDDDIQIFWTGIGVCGHADEQGVSCFTDNVGTLGESGGKAARKPLMWINWPCNDINRKRLVLGPGSNEGGAPNRSGGAVDVLDQGYAKYYAGIISNPMEQAQLNKIPLFAIADFSWNDDTYNGQQSWKDSFKYVEPDASNELMELAKHLQDPSPNTHNMVCGESEEIKPLLEEFQTKYENGESVKTIGTQLITEYDKIISAADGLLEKSKNKGLINEISSFALSLKSLATGSKEFILTAFALEDKNDTEVWTHYSQGTAQLAKSKTFTIVNIDGPSSLIEAGAKRLIPFANNLSQKLADPVNQIINPDAVTVTTNFFIEKFSYYGNSSGKDVLDNNDDTYAHLIPEPNSNDHTYPDSSYGIEFSKLVELKAIRILQGKPDGSDKLEQMSLEYSTDGTTYQLLDSFTDGRLEIKKDYSHLGLKVKKIRLRNLQETNGWTAVREFQMFEDDPSQFNPTFFKSDNITFAANNNDYGPDSKVTDGDDTTYAYYAKNPYEDPNRDSIPAKAYVGLKFDKDIRLGKIHILQGADNSHGDILKNAVLEYSSDGNTYTILKDNINENVVDFDAANSNIYAKYVRLRNTEETGKWFALRTFKVTSSGTNGKVYTNAEAYKNTGATIKDTQSFIKDIDNITLAPNEYIGIKLSRIRDINYLETNYTHSSDLVLEASCNEVEFSAVNPKEINDNNRLPARYIRIINKTNASITFNLVSLLVQSKEITEITLIENTIGGNISGDPADLFDGKLTTEVHFQGSQREGAYLTYDLGQTITINSLQMVVKDSENDFIRNAKLQVSLDNQAWTDVMTIGNGNTDPSDYGGSYLELMLQNGWWHELAYCVTGSKNGDSAINQPARYLRIYLTSGPGASDKWVRMREITINSNLNNGVYNPDYLPVENNPTFISEPVEARDHHPALLIDGNLNTTYKADQTKGTSGYLVYRLSENLQNIKKINILQSPGTISNAEVLVRKINNNEYTTIGTLAYSMNEFNISSLNEIAEIKIVWDGIVPELHEIITSSKIAEPDKSLLKASIDKANAIDETKYSSDSIHKMKEAKIQAQTIYDNPYVMQSAVNQARIDLDMAIEALLNIEDKSSLLELYNKYKDIKNNNYNKELWSKFQEALSYANSILLKEEAASLEIEEAYTMLVQAYENLVNSKPEDTDIVLEENGVVVIGHPGVIPINTKLVVEQITKDGMYDISKLALKDIGTKIHVFDILLYADGTRITPNGAVQIKLPIPENFEKSKLQVYHIAENGIKTLIPSAVENNHLVINTDHFSVYTIVEKEDKTNSDDIINEAADNSNNNNTNHNLVITETKEAIVTINGNITIDKDNTLSFSLNDKEILNGIEQSKQLKKEGKANKIVIKFSLTDQKQTDNDFKITLSQQAATLMAEANIDNLVVELPKVSITFDKKAVDIIASHTEKNLQIEVRKPKQLSAIAKKLLESRPVYDIKLNTAENTISNFQNGNVTIKIPYTLENSEHADDIGAIYINNSGKINSISDSKYNEKEKAVILNTNHFSTYGVINKTALTAEPVSVYQGNTNLIRLTDIPSNSKITYQSSNKQIAKVNKNTGKLKGVKPGKTTIMATITSSDSEYQISIDTIVKKSSIKLVKKTAKLKAGKTYRFKAKATGIKKSIVWSVNNKDIAKINKKTGKLKGKEAGTVIVTAKAGKIKSTYKVKIKK